MWSPTLTARFLSTIIQHSEHASRRGANGKDVVLAHMLGRRHIRLWGKRHAPRLTSFHPPTGFLANQSGQYIKHLSHSHVTAAIRQSSIVLSRSFIYTTRMICKAKQYLSVAILDTVHSDTSPEFHVPTKLQAGSTNLKLIFSHSYSNNFKLIFN